MALNAAVLAVLLAAAPDAGVAPGKALRVLVRVTDQAFLPPQANPESHELELLEEFAARNGQALERVSVDSFEELLPALAAGKGDVVAAGLTVTKERAKSAAFTRPVETVDEVLVGRKAAPNPPKSPKDLAGRAVHVAAGSAFVETLESLKAAAPGLTVEVVRGAFPPDQLAFDVARGARPYTVVDSRRLAAMQQYLPELTPLFPLAKDRPIAFALRPADVTLRARLDAFLMEHAFWDEAEGPSAGDLDAIKKRGSLRVLTRNNAVSFYLHRGERFGFDYELAALLAKQLGVHLEVVLAPSYDQLIPMLKAGEGDVIAASLTVTPARAEAVAFSTPYLFVKELLVQRRAAKAKVDAGVPRVTRLEELKGQRVTVRASSSYAGTLERLQVQAGPFTVVPADEDAEVEDLIADVAAGRADFTVADSHFLAAELLYRDDVEAPLPLTEDRPIAFAVRKENVKLLEAVNGFVRRTYRGAEYNVLKRRSFENKRVAVAARAEDPARTGRLSAYDGVIKKYSDVYGFDWRLMSAQAWRESHFDPKAKSWVGALGLFQVMPATGKDLGFTRLHDPDQGTHAGIKYMGWLVKRLEPTLPLPERVRFSLAAYNAGFTRLEDARRLAGALKLSPDVWSGNVEKAMGLLAQPRYAKHARGGYCRCQEPVDYVRAIEEKYQSYVQLVPDGAGGR